MEAAEKALAESYKTITTEEVQKSQQFVSLNKHLQSQATKLNAVNKMKSIPTTREREEMRRPIVKKFQMLLDSIISYNEIHTNMLFYPKRRRIEPKAVFIPEASPRDIYDYFIHGLIDMLYIDGNSLKELQKFPLNVPSIIKSYKEFFASRRELFLNMHSGYPIFDIEQKLLVPSITVAQLGVINQKYPPKDEDIEPTTRTMENLAYTLVNIFAASSKIGLDSGQTDKIRINFCLKNLLIYSNYQEKIDKAQLKVLSDFEEQFETFSGLLAPLLEDLKQRLCEYVSRTTRHHYCSEGTNASPVMED
ncbi:hypothetical protein Tco_1106854 [Tanacetum coccineum]